MQETGSVLQESSTAVQLELKKLRPPSRPLRPISDQLVSELERSIRNTGLLQPIVARKCAEGYEVVFGNHRLEACRRLGMKTISTIINSFTEEEAFLARVSENLLRNTYINPVEESEGYNLLLKNGWTIGAIAGRVGKCDSYICERLALLDRLDSGLRSRLSHDRGHLTPSHAELLSRIPDRAQQNEIANFVERKRLSVRALEDLLNGVPAPRKIQVQNHSDGCYLTVPGEFSEAIGLTPGQSVYTYVHGSKLTIENIDGRKARRKRESTDRWFARANVVSSGSRSLRLLFLSSDESTSKSCKAG